MNRRRTQNRPKPAAVSDAPRVRANVRAWRAHHRASFVVSLQRLAARPLGSALTLAVLGLALTLPLLFWLVLDNARGLSAGLEDARAVSAFLKPDLDAAAVAALAQRLGQRGDVASVQVRSPEQGLEEFRSQSGFADALKVLHYNPLPAVLIITLRALPGDASPALVSELKRDPAVELVQYDAEWRQRLDAILAVVERSAVVVAILLALAAVLVIGNTVRVDIQARRDEIGVMQLLGASDAFVRRPFLYTGFCYGFFAAILALMVVGMVEWVLAAPLTQLTASYGGRFAVHGLPFAAMAAALLASAGLGWLGAWFAASRHIALGQPE